MSCGGASQTPVFHRIPTPDGEVSSAAVSTQLSLEDDRVRVLEGRGHPGSTSQIVFFAPRWAVRRAPVTQETQPGVLLSWKRDGNGDEARPRKLGLERPQKLRKCSISVSGELKSEMSA